MAEKRGEFDREFREGAVRVVLMSGKPLVQVARGPGVTEGTLGNWVNLDPAVSTVPLMAVRLRNMLLKNIE